MSVRAHSRQSVSEHKNQAAEYKRCPECTETGFYQRHGPGGRLQEKRSIGGPDEHSNLHHTEIAALCLFIEFFSLYNQQYNWKAVQSLRKGLLALRLEKWENSCAGDWPDVSSWKSAGQATKVIFCRHSTPLNSLFMFFFFFQRFDLRIFFLTRQIFLFFSFFFIGCLFCFFVYCLTNVIFYNFFCTILLL